MLNKEKHQTVMGNVLRALYRDSTIAPLLGFKGGTCVYFFYDLTRFSVDLDFDLLETDETTQKKVFETIEVLLKEYKEVEIKDKYIKQHTIFFLLSYGVADHNVKIEINTRPLMPNMRSYYEIKEYLGISMLVAKPEYLFASKLVALTARKKKAMRDIYDVWFFLSKLWRPNEAVIEARTGKKIKDYLDDCVLMVEKVNDNEILAGLGELLGSEKEKNWVKTNLRQETIFSLKNYQAAISR